MKKIIFFIAVPLIIGGGIYLSPSRDVAIRSSGGRSAQTIGSFSLPDMPEATSAPIDSAASPPQPVVVSVPTSSSATAPSSATSQLQNPPVVVRGLYMTRSVAGIPSWVDRLVKTAKEKNLNAVVVDVKDYSGFVLYKTGIPEVAAAGAEKSIQVRDIGALLKKLHDNGLYAIARITVFQDPVLAVAHPEWALKNKKTGLPWTDRKGLRWMDAAGEGTRRYVASLGHDALSRGFDEINFDYIRFPSDGALEDASYPFWDEKTPRSEVMLSFYKYLRSEFPHDKISADLFGLVVLASDDLGIGQELVDAAQYFDYICPMIYPSHFAKGFIGYKNPADYPYEVISYSLQKALAKYAAKHRAESVSLNTTGTVSVSGSLPLARLRPWLQEFDLGATYTKAMIEAQIKATDAVLNSASSSAYYAGWLLWDPSNKYSRL